MFFFIYKKLKREHGEEIDDNDNDEKNFLMKKTATVMHITFVDTQVVEWGRASSSLGWPGSDCV